MLTAQFDNIEHINYYMVFSAYIIDVVQTIAAKPAPDFKYANTGGGTR